MAPVAGRVFTGGEGLFGHGPGHRMHGFYGGLSRHNVLCAVLRVRSVSAGLFVRKEREQPGFLRAVLSVLTCAGLVVASVAQLFVPLKCLCPPTRAAGSPQPVRMALSGDYTALRGERKRRVYANSGKALSTAGGRIRRRLRGTSAIDPPARRN